MRLLFILSFVILASCAKSDQAKRGEPVTCVDQIFPMQALYPDGQIRKSAEFVCSDGCFRYEFVNDPSIFFNTCERL